MLLVRAQESSAPSAETEAYSWQGADEYTELDDRKDAPPLPLPSLRSPRRIVLVRHGQSTWNAEGRIQGSCNVSRLTDKGRGQAEATGDLVCSASSCALTYVVRRLLCASDAAAGLGAL